MTELPPALASWSEQLDFFPREIATSLAPLLSRLDRLVGPLRTSLHRGDGEPDGFDGLSRRGIYDRLLLSEWLLADEAPLEFARRASTGEHTFLQIARREPQGAPLSLALFDAGPNQIGAPRLVHLAALLVLARRARNAGAHFRWGVLQTTLGEDALHSAPTEHTVKALLSARSAREATTDDWQRWQEVIAQETATHTSSDIWVIGGERLVQQKVVEHRVLEQAETAPSMLLVRDHFENWNETDSKRVRARVVESESNRAPREIILDLPDDKTCARLLRDPFAVAVAATKRASHHYSGGSNFVWGSESKLLARSSDESYLIVYDIPNSPRATVGKPRIYRPKAYSSGGNTKIVAAGRTRKAIVVVTQISSAQIVIEAWGKNSDYVPQGKFDLPFAMPESRDEMLYPCAFLPDTTDKSFFALLPNRRLLKITSFLRKSALWKDREYKVTFENQNALALQGRSKDVVFVSANDGVFRLHNAKKKAIFKLPNTIQAAFMGSGTTPGRESLSLTALQTTDEHWVVPRELGSLFWDLPASTRVQGVIALPDRWPTPALVTIEDENKVVLRGDNWTFELPSLGAPVEHVSVSSFAPDIAMRTITSEIAVYSLRQDAWTMRLSTEKNE